MKGIVQPGSRMMWHQFYLLNAGLLPWAEGYVFHLRALMKEWCRRGDFPLGKNSLGFIIADTRCPRYLLDEEWNQSLCFSQLNHSMCKMGFFLSFLSCNFPPALSCTVESNNPLLCAFHVVSVALCVLTLPAHSCSFPRPGCSSMFTVLHVHCFDILLFASNTSRTVLDYSHCQCCC